MPVSYSNWVKFRGHCVCVRACVRVCVRVCVKIVECTCQCALIIGLNWVNTASAQMVECTCLRATVFGRWLDEFLDELLIVVTQLVFDDVMFVQQMVEHKQGQSLVLKTHNGSDKHKRDIRPCPTVIYLSPTSYHSGRSGVPTHFHNLSLNLRILSSSTDLTNHESRSLMFKYVVRDYLKYYPQ